jgi:hypothetical protein
LGSENGWKRASLKTVEIEHPLQRHQLRFS